MRQRLVVIGGSGFLGRQLISHCTDWDVISVDRLPYGAERPGNVQEIVADASDTEVLDAACRGAALVWLRAGVLGGAQSVAMEKLPQYLDVNVELVRTVLAACTENGVRRIVFDSSEQVWGSSGDLERQRADGEPFAGNFYGASKLVAEKMIRHWASSAADRSAQVFRYSRVRAASTRDVIYYMALASLQGKPIRLVGNPSHQISFVHVDDVMAANVAALTIAPRFAVYQVSADRPYALWELAQLVRDVTGADVGIEFDWAPTSAMPFESFVTGMEWEESSRRLGVAPKWSVAAMIHETVAALQTA
jgi:UDP-glucose 4-epimerase